MTLQVLVVGPALQFPWIEYTARAFRRLGHQVTGFRYSNIWVNRSESPVLAKKLAGVPALSGALTRYAQQWRRARDHALVELARRMRPDLVVVLRGELIAEETLRGVRQAARGPLVTWWTDDPQRYPVSRAWWQLYDHAFLFDRSCVQRLASTGATAAHFLPCACDETVYKPQILNRRDRARYRADVALVSWYYPNRAEVVNALRGLNVNVWGRGWTSREARQALNGAGPAVIRGGGYVREKMAAKIYSASVISLNIHHPQSRQAGLNMRTFEQLAVGAFELVDAIPGMEELLVPGREVATYHSPDEARELIDYYLRHPDARTRMVERGRARTLREHTYRHRMDTILRTVALRARAFVAVADEVR